MNGTSNSGMLALLTFVFLLLAVESTEAAGRKAGEYVPEQLVCGLTDSADISTINTTFGTTVLSYLPQLGSFLLQTLPGQNADSLSSFIAVQPPVIYCSPNYYSDAPEPVQGSQPFIDAVPNIEKYTGQSSVNQLQLAATQTISTGANVKVGVIDVGINFSHPALQGVAVTGADYIDGGLATDPAGGSASGHGTFAAGVIHLVAPLTQIVAYRVMDTSGRGTGFTVAEAILQAIADSCKVINLSMVMTGKNGTADKAIEFARNHNVLVVAAGGNDGNSTERFPASDSYAIGVAAVDSLFHKAGFSNFNGKVDICAPGTSIYSPYLDSSYAWWDGTSFAAPFVVGEAALILSRRPGLRWSDLVDAITGSAANIDALNPTYVGNLGSGIINPQAALARLGVVCGDVDQNGQGPDISDLTALIDYLFISLSPLSNPGLADVDGDVGIDISDLSLMIDNLFINFTPLQCKF